MDLSTIEEEPEPSAVGRRPDPFFGRGALRSRLGRISENAAEGARSAIQKMSLAAYQALAEPR